MEDVAVDAGETTPETPSEVTTPAESETPSVDASAVTDGGDSAGSQTVDPLLAYVQSKGFKDLNDPAARTALHEGIRSAQNFASTSAKRIKELEAQLAQRATPAKPAEPETPPEPHPDVKSLDEGISAIKAKLDALPTKEATLVREVYNLDLEIAKADARLEAADDLDKPKRELELAKLVTARDNKAGQLDSLPEIRERYEADLRRAERDRKLTVQAIEAEESARQQAGEQQKTWETSFNAEVDSLIPRIADELKLPADASLRALMSEDVTEGLIVDLWKRADANISDVNVQELIRSRVEKWAKKNGLVQAAKLAQVSKEKAPVAGKPNGVPQRSATAPNPPNRTPSIHDQVEAERKARLAKMASLGW